MMSKNGVARRFLSGAAFVTPANVGVTALVNYGPAPAPA